MEGDAQTAGNSANTSPRTMQVLQLWQRKPSYSHVSSTPWSTARLKRLTCLERLCRQTWKVRQYT